MKMRTRVLDGLYLNWALPASRCRSRRRRCAMSATPGRGASGSSPPRCSSASRGSTCSLVPFVRVSYPQFNLRLYVVDDDGVPSVYFHTVLVPGWVVPAARAMGQLPAAAAHFRYPPPSREVPAGSGAGGCAGAARSGSRRGRSSPMMGEGPPLGSWDDTVRYFRERPRGYAEVAGELRRVDTEQPRVAVWPVAAAVTDAGLLADCLPLGRAGAGATGIAGTATAPAAGRPSTRPGSAPRSPSPSS